MRHVLMVLLPAGAAGAAGAVAPATATARAIQRDLGVPQRDRKTDSCRGQKPKAKVWWRR